MCRKLISIVLVVCLFTGLIPGQVFADTRIPVNLQMLTNGKSLLSGSIPERITIQTFNKTTQKSSSAVPVNIKLINTGKDDIDLSQVKLKYYNTPN